MPVVDIFYAILPTPEKWAHWRRFNGGGRGQIRPGVLSWKQGLAQRSEGSQPAGLDILLCQFHQNSEEPQFLRREKILAYGHHPSVLTNDAVHHALTSN